MSILYIRNTDGTFIQIPMMPGKSAYQIAIERGVFTGTEQEFAEAQVIPNKEILDQITQENIDKWEKEVDLKHLATKDELNTKANISDVPTKVSQLDNDSNYISSIPNEYITETELDDKGYLTEHQNINHLATKNELTNGLGAKANISDLPTRVSQLTNDSGYATETYVKNEIAQAKLEGEDNKVNLDGYATKDELATKANISDLPTRVSQLTNDSGYLTNIPSEYITETELDDKGYLTEHQSISHLATKTELANELTTKANISDIPTKVSQLTNDNNYISSIPSEYITETELDNMGYLTEHQDISHLASKDDLTNGLSSKANTSDIPTKTSQLTNDSNFISSIPSEYITETELNAKNYLTEHQDISHLASKTDLANGLNIKANTSDIPTKVSDLTNDSNYITEDELDNRGYLVEQDISHLATETYVKNEIAKAQLEGEDNKVILDGYATKDELATKANVSDIPTKTSQLDNDSGYITEIPSDYITENELDNKGYLTEHQNISHLASKEELNSKANITDIPTKVSQLTNDSNFLTEIPSEYVTEIELNNKGYLTEHQDISHLASKEELANELVVKANISDIPTKISDLTNDRNYLTNIPSEYITETELENNLSIKANVSDIPTKVSDLTNDSNYINESYVENKITEVTSSMETIESSDFAPTDENVTIWINTSEDTATNPLARVNDDIVSNSHAWSSEKINDLFNSLRLIKEGNVIKLMLGNIELSNISID